ncbi:MAG: hypothetical protein JRL30_20270 [Deltaproteobacteria bacterium]|nr:hypothetical protein [Deltaproteobacteria bacterium]
MKHGKLIDKRTKNYTRPKEEGIPKGKKNLIRNVTIDGEVVGDIEIGDGFIHGIIVYEGKWLKLIGYPDNDNIELFECDEPDGPGEKIRCVHCGDVIQSMYRHNLVHCKCKRIFIDGGNAAYTRIGFKDEDDYEHVD